MTDNRTREDLLSEMEELRYRLEEAEETLYAIKNGAVDALVVSVPEGERIFTLQGADYSYRVLVETMNEGAATLAPDGTIIYCNNRLAAMLKLPLEKLIGDRLDSHVAPIDQALFTTRLETCALECDTVEISLIASDGEPLPVLFSCCAMELSGEPGIGVVLADIRAQKETEKHLQEAKMQVMMAKEREQAEAALRVSETRYHTLFNEMDQGYCIIEMLYDDHGRPNDWRFIEVNPAFAKHNGLTDAVGKTIRQTTPNIETKWFEWYGQVALTGCPVRFEEHSEALERWFDLYAFQVGQPEQHLVAVLFTDITKRKQAEAALRASEERERQRVEELQTIFDTVPIGLAIAKDKMGLHIRGNRANEEMFGLPSGGELSMAGPRPAGFRVIRDGRDLTVPELPMQRAVRGESVHEQSLDVVREDGSALVVYAKAAPLFDNDGLPRGAVGVFLDITELRNAENSLKQLNEELEQRVTERTAELRERDRMLLLQSRQAAMGEMIGNIAHQWRQPLNTLGLYTQRLGAFYGMPNFNKEFLDSSIDKSMELIKHMSKTIDDFRDYFKPEKEKADFYVLEAIHNTMSLLEGSFHNPKIIVDIIEHCNPVINGYQNELAQVFLNILNNARDAIIERNIADAKVTITISNEVNRAVVTIADNAGGIPDEIIDKVFDPYFTTKGPQVGTGIGLFMSKTIVEKNMGGSIAVRNTDTGAEFTIEVSPAVKCSSLRPAPQYSH